MRQFWISNGLRMAVEKNSFYCGCRKIIRNQHITLKELDESIDSLTIRDCGYTKSKITMLRRNYIHEESLATAVQLWERRKSQRKYGSVGFTTYNHLLKSDPNKKAKRASVMGPCIQAVTLTYLKNHTCAVDMFYRTTEWFKKFPADLVFLRDEVLTRFDFTLCPMSEITFHFANVTMHPMYFVTMIPLIDHPTVELDRIRKHDKYFFDWTIKWTARYLLPEYHRGIEKFSQALRVSKDASTRIPKSVLVKLQAYLKRYHPGYRNDY